MTKPEEINQSY